MLNKGECCASVIFIYLSVVNFWCSAFEILMVIFLNPGNWKNRQTLWSWKTIWGMQLFVPWLRYLVLPLVASDSKSTEDIASTYSTADTPVVTWGKNKTLGEGARGSSRRPGAGGTSAWSSPFHPTGTQGRWRQWGRKQSHLCDICPCGSHSTVGSCTPFPSFPTKLSPMLFNSGR